MGTIRFQSLRDRYVALFGEEAASGDAIASIEATLDVVLPDDMKQIARFYGGGFLGGISHHAIATCGPANNVLQETERLRCCISLPHRLVALAEPPESLIVLDCESRISTSPAVVWCDAQDVSRLDNIAALSKPETWRCYADFFAYLLGEEEIERARRRGEES